MGEAQNKKGEGNGELDSLDRLCIRWSFKPPSIKSVEACSSMEFDAMWRLLFKADRPLANKARAIRIWRETGRRMLSVRKAVKLMMEEL